jgi:hypothetical protein
MDPKEQRNKKVVSLHNEGKTVREIAELTGVSKTLVSNVITAHIESLKNKPASIEVKPKQSEPAATSLGKRIYNFGEYQYTGTPNEYAHKQTGEVIKVTFVKATTPSGCGHFVTV